MQGEKRASRFFLRLARLLLLATREDRMRPRALPRVKRAVFASVPRLTSGLFRVAQVLSRRAQAGRHAFREDANLAVKREAPDVFFRSDGFD